MPELPEVESLRRSLEPILVGRLITSAKLLRRDVFCLPGDPKGGWSRNPKQSPLDARPVKPSELLAKGVVARIRRHGKQLAIIDTTGRTLLVHLGMTGAVEAHDRTSDLPPHTHAVWQLERGPRFVFKDPRRFGGLWYFPCIEDLERRWASLGDDALRISAESLHARLRARRRPVKAALLDQAIIAGVGNIYADEALHEARMHPERAASSLKRPDTARLLEAIQQILRRAINAGGSTLQDYHDPNGRPGAFQHEHKVYGRSGLPCSHCGMTLQSALVAQRRSTWCPKCQRKPKNPTGTPASHNVNNEREI